MRILNTVQTGGLPFLVCVKVENDSVKQSINLYAEWCFLYASIEYQFPVEDGNLKWILPLII